MEEKSGTTFTDFVVMVLLAIMIAPPLLAAFVPAVGRWLLDSRVLTTENVILPVSGQAGLDIVRIMIGGAFVIALAVIGIASRRRDV